MKKTLIGLSMAALFGSYGAHAGLSAYSVPPVSSTNNNFTMLGPGSGFQVGGTNDVTFTWDGTYNTSVAGAVDNATLSSPTGFFATYLYWTAHNVKIYAPGTYSIDTGSPANTTNPGGKIYSWTVPPGHVGAHMLFDWNTTTNIDVLVTWRLNKSWSQTTTTDGCPSVGTPCPFETANPNAGGNTAATVWGGVSVDTPASIFMPFSTADEVNTWNGTQMIDGPFIGYSANFNVNGIQAFDETPPTVSGTSPATGVTGVSPGAINYSVTFNEKMAGSVTSSALTFSPAVAVGTPTTADGITWSFPVTLAASTAYTVTLNAGPTDLAGNALTLPGNKTFSTGATVDATSPTIASSAPTSGATGVSASAQIAVAFSEPMGGSTANAIALTKGGTLVPCTFVANSTNSVFTCTPATPLLGNSVYTVSVAGAATRTPSNSAAAQDVSGNNLITAAGTTWSFTTAAVTTMTTGGATITIGAGTGSLVSFAVLTPGQIGGTAPAHTTLDKGLSYAINGVSGSVAVTLTFPVSIAGKTLYKVDNAKTYTVIPESAFTRSSDGMSITIVIVDNGPYDTDATLGSVADPIVAAVGATAPTLNAPGASGGGCAINPGAKFDASLLLAVLSSFAYLARRRAAKKQ